MVYLICYALTSCPTPYLLVSVCLMSALSLILVSGILWTAYHIIYGTLNCQFQSTALWSVNDCYEAWNQMYENFVSEGSTERSNKSPGGFFKCSMWDVWWVPEIRALAVVQGTDPDATYYLHNQKGHRGVCRTGCLPLLYCPTVTALLGCSAPFFCHFSLLCRYSA